MIVVAGAGPAGLATALAARRSGAQVTVVERRDALGGGYGIVLNPSAVRTLDELGVWHGVASHARPVGALPPRSSPTTALRWVLRREQLMSALARPLGDAIQFRAEVSGIHSGGTAITLRDGREIATRAVVGADGVHSTTARHVGGVPPLRSDGSLCWRGVADLGRVPFVGERWTHGMRYGCLPLADGRVYWYVSSARDLDLARLPDWLAPLLRSADAPLTLVDRAPRTRWHRGGVVLVGDAVAPTTPSLGLEACRGIVAGAALGRDLASMPVEEAARRHRRRARLTGAVVTGASALLGTAAHRARPRADLPAEKNILS